jgi:hypothetical protein
MDRMPGLCRGEPSCPYYVHEDPDRECIDGLARLNRRARWNGPAKVLTTMVKPGQLARNSERIAARQHAPELDVQVPEACTYYGSSAHVSFPHEGRCGSVSILCTRSRSGPSSNKCAWGPDRQPLSPGVRVQDYPASPEDRLLSRAHGPRSCVLTSEWSHDRDAPLRLNL